MGKECAMSPFETYTSRKGEVPCGDRDLYAFLTDMRNFKTVLQSEDIISDWEATQDKCSFKIEKAGKISITRGEALAHSMITYIAETFFTDTISIKVMIEYITNSRSVLYITAGLNMTPLVKMFIGDSAGMYMNNIIDAIVSYDGFGKIRGCNQSL
jgi:hypothetical protein